MKYKYTLQKKRLKVESLSYILTDKINITMYTCTFLLVSEKFCLMKIVWILIVLI